MTYRKTRRIPRVQAGFKLDSDLYKRVWAEADLLGTTFSEVITIALLSYFERKKEG